MKKTALIITCFLKVSAAIAQPETKQLNFNDSIEVVLQDERAPLSMIDNFSSIKIVDARDDSSEIGYCYSEGGYYYNRYSEKIRNKCYRIIPSAQKAIEIWCTNYFQLNKQDTARNTLLIVLKKFWISPDATPVVFSYDKKGQPTEGFDPGIISNIEFYLKKDTVFYPLYRFDSVLTFTDKLPLYAGACATETLKTSFNKLFNINWANIYKKKIKLSFEEILFNSRINTRLPILNDSNLKKGAYKNFEEFKMNSPSYTDYEFRKGKLGDILYVKENGLDYPERKVWGYCNGKEIFINSADTYSKLIKRQNTFYFDGIKGIIRTTRHDFWKTNLFKLATNTGSKHIAYSKINKYYTVDMETGDVY